MLNIAIGIVVVHITAVSRCRLPLPIRESVIQVALSNPSTIPVQWEYLRTYRGSAVEDVSGILLSKVESLERHEIQDLAYTIALILASVPPVAIPSGLSRHWRTMRCNLVIFSTPPKPHVLF